MARAPTSRMESMHSCLVGLTRAASRKSLLPQASLEKMCMTELPDVELMSYITLDRETIEMIKMLAAFPNL